MTPESNTPGFRPIEFICETLSLPQPKEGSTRTKQCLHHFGFYSSEELKTKLEDSTSEGQLKLGRKMLASGLALSIGGALSLGTVGALGGAGAGALLQGVGALPGALIGGVAGLMIGLSLGANQIGEGMEVYYTALLQKGTTANDSVDSENSEKGGWKKAAAQTLLMALGGALFLCVKEQVQDWRGGSPSDPTELVEEAVIEKNEDAGVGLSNSGTESTKLGILTRSGSNVSGSAGIAEDISSGEKRSLTKGLKRLRRNIKSNQSQRGKVSPEKKLEKLARQDPGSYLQSLLDRAPKMGRSSINSKEFILEIEVLKNVIIEICMEYFEEGEGFLDKEIEGTDRKMSNSINDLIIYHNSFDPTSLSNNDIWHEMNRLRDAINQNIVGVMPEKSHEDLN